MEITRCRLFYFSPCGGTKRAGDALVRHFPWPLEEYNLLHPIAETACTENDLAVFAFPVYSGRIPVISPGAFERLTGNGAPAVIMPVYGNRAYEEAAINLDVLAKRRGFVPVAGVTAVAEHSIFPTIGAGRPDEADHVALAGFAEKIVDYLGRLRMDFRRTFRPPGFEIVPNKLPKDLFTPAVNQDTCTRCKECVAVCPTGAIDPNAPNTTYVPHCLWCQGCIRVCPTNARFLNHPVIGELRTGMEERCAPRKEAELWLP